MLRPTQDWLILEMIEPEKSIIAVPDSYKKEEDPNTTFKVLAVGPGYYDFGVFIKSTIRVGDVVYISSFGMTKIEYNSKKIILGRARDVVMIVDRKEVLNVRDGVKGPTA